MSMDTMLDEAKARTKLFDQALALKAKHPGLGTKNAYLWAKNLAKPLPDYSYVPHTDEAFTLDDSVDGFDIRIDIEYDAFASANDWLGEWTDTPTEDSVDVRPWTSDTRGYRYFTPAYGYAERVETARRRGAARHVAHEMARQGLIDDAKRAIDFTEYTITVTASRNGVELGSDVVGGVGFENPWYDSDEVIRYVLDDSDLVAWAVDDATETLNKLIEGSAE